MKILYVVTRGDVIGGASMHVLELAGEMQRSGHDVHVLLGAGDVVAQLASQRGLTVLIEPLLLREIAPWQDLRCLFRLRALLRQLQPDVLHLHSAKAGLLGRIVAKWCRVPVVYSVHGWSFSMYQGFKARSFRLIERLLLPLTDRLVLVCQRDVDIARDQLGARGEQMVLVHNGIMETPVKPKFAEGSDTVCRIISVARFEEPKDQRTLIKAMSRLLPSQWQLVFVGDGPTLTDCRQLASDLALSNIEFLGERSDVADLLSSADVFVLSSFSESLPVSVIEAMRAGLPVIASNVGGMAELIQEGHNGFLVAAGDVNDFSQKLDTLIADPCLRQQMGAFARSKFEAKFTLQQNSNLLMHLYNQLLEAA